MAWSIGADDSSSRTLLQHSTDRLKPKRLLATGPSVASAEIQGASVGPSQIFSVLPSRSGESYSWLVLAGELGLAHLWSVLRARALYFVLSFCLATRPCVNLGPRFLLIRPQCPRVGGASRFERCSATLSQFNRRKHQAMAP
jgi:hypothetical protein